MVEITPQELKQVLWDSGYKIKEFTDSIGRSKSFFDNSIVERFKYVPPRYLEAAIELIGQDAFDYALMNNKNYHHRKKREEEFKMKRLQDKSLSSE